MHVFVGASDQDFEQVRPILATLGDVRHVGQPDAGAAIKLVNNLTLGATIVAFGEALALARSFGLDDRDAVLDVFAESPIGPAGRTLGVESRAASHCRHDAPRCHDDEDQEYAV